MTRTGAVVAALAIVTAGVTLAGLLTVGWQVMCVMRGEDVLVYCEDYEP